MTQKILALSKLSRGQGYDRGPYIEILYDDEVNRSFKDIHLGFIHF